MLKFTTCLYKAHTCNLVFILFQIKDGISMDVKQIENMKVTKDDFEQALLDVEPVGIT